MCGVCVSNVCCVFVCFLLVVLEFFMVCVFLCGSVRFVCVSFVIVCLVLLISCAC